MNGVTKVIDELGLMILAREVELEKKQTEIEQLKQKIEMIEQYLEAYENIYNNV